MSANRSIKLNFVMNAILTMSSFIFPFITFPYISRILLPAGTGKVSMATSVVTYFNMFAQLGIPLYGVKVCAAVRDDKEKLTRTAHELLLINLIMGALAYVVLAIAVATVPKLRAEKPLYVIISATILLSAIGMEWLYKALEQYVYITVRSVIFKFVALIAMFLLIHKQSDYVIYGGISIFAASASNVLNFINAHRYIGMRRVGGYDLRRHLKPIGIFFAMSCATTIYTNLDKVMLGFMVTDEDVGYYDAAVKIKTILVSIVTSLGTVLLPRASYYVNAGLGDEFRRISRKALGFVALAATPLMIYFMLFAREGIFLLSGAAYAGSIVPMQIIMPTLLLIGLTNILGVQMLIPLGREKVVLYSEIAGAVTDLILNAILIPHLASAGAALGTLAAEFVVLIVQYRALRTEVGDSLKAIHWGRIAIGIAIGAAASFWTKYLPLHDFLRLLLSACLFFGCYGGLMLLRREELVCEIFSQVMGKLHRSRGR